MTHQYKFTLGPKQREQMAQANAEFHHAYGIALAQWAKLERVLYYWFGYITKMSDPMARAVFYSARSFGARAEMLECAIDASALPANEVTFIRQALKRAWGYSSFRNSITHGEPIANMKALNGQVQNVEYYIVQGSTGPSPNDVTLEHLAAAAENFHSLSQIIHDAHPIVGGNDRKSPEECLALLNALPTQPHSKNAPNPSTPEQQHQCGRVNKKEYRAQQEVKKNSEGGE
jgi:hypothetical protein